MTETAQYDLTGSSSFELLLFIRILAELSNYWLYGYSVVDYKNVIWIKPLKKYILIIRTLAESKKIQQSLIIRILQLKRIFDYKNII